MHIDFTATTRSQPTDMEVDSQNAAAPDWHSAFAATQPETPMDDIPFEWEAPPRMAAYGISASQPTTATDHDHAHALNDFAQQLGADPAMSQFTQSHQVPLSLTQVAKQFRDIAPAHALTRFYSAMAGQQLLQLLAVALHEINVPTPTPKYTDTGVYLFVKVNDSRKQALCGNVVVEMVNQAGLLEVRFVKSKGDPVEWRRLFKRVVVRCRDAIVVPREEGMYA